MSKNTKSTNPKDKYGRAKVPLELIPSTGLAIVAKVMQTGAEKYGPYNWRESAVDNMVYVGAALRHIHEYLDGLDKDLDSGFHPMAHVAACCLIVLDAELTGNLIDNRPLKAATAELHKALQTEIKNEK